MVHDDLVSLAKTCRLVRDLAQDHLAQHRGLMTELGRISSQGRPREACRYLRWIIERPHLIPYTRRIFIDDWQTQYANATNAEIDDVTSILDSWSHGYLKPFLKDIIVWPGGVPPMVPSTDEMRTKIGQGDEGPMIAWLCALLPELNHIGIRVPDSPDTWRYMGHVLWYGSLLRDKFRHLTTLEIRGDTGAAWREEAFKMLQQGRAIKTVRTLIGWSCQSAIGHSAEATQDSDVERVVLRSCELSPLAVADFIKGMKQLRHFKYTQNTLSIALVGRPDTPTLRKALARHSATLETPELIRLDLWYWAQDYYGSFRCFGRLREITIEFRLLFDPKRDDWSWSAHNPTTELPASIERVHLMCDGQIDVLEELLNAWVERGCTGLPNLKTLRISGLVDAELKRIREAVYTSAMTMAAIQIEVMA